MGIPRHLYHYTSVNTLALILKYRCFRFNSLENMDDYDEVKILDKKLGKYCFVSCWTELNEELIPMWKMYADDSQGVRIKLPVYPFKKFKVDDKVYYLDPEEAIHDDYYFRKPEYSMLRPVSYKSIEEVDKIKNGSYALDAYKYLNFDTAGCYKNSYWGFQSEWRYIINAVPTRERVTNMNQKIDYDYLQNEPPIPIAFKDLIIDEKAFTQMEITLGPRINGGDEIIVKSLVEKYNPDAKIIYSQLHNRM